MCLYAVSDFTYYCQVIISFDVNFLIIYGHLIPVLRNSSGGLIAPHLHYGLMFDLAHPLWNRYPQLAYGTNTI